MRLVTIHSGQNFTLYAVEHERAGVWHCPVTEFLSELPESDQKAMLGVIRLHADHGPVLNERKSKLLRDGISEFKTDGGYRMLWFYTTGRRTVMTHGFKKIKRYDDEIDRAIRCWSDLEGAGLL